MCLVCPLLPQFLERKRPWRAGRKLTEESWLQKATAGGPPPNPPGHRQHPLWVSMTAAMPPCPRALSSHLSALHSAKTGKPSGLLQP